MCVREDAAVEHYKCVWHFIKTGHRRWFGQLDIINLIWVSGRYISRQYDEQNSKPIPPFPIQINTVNVVLTVDLWYVTYAKYGTAISHRIYYVSVDRQIFTFQKEKKVKKDEKKWTDDKKRYNRLGWIQNIFCCSFLLSKKKWRIK